MTQDGLLICFTGIDGSGKTTQAELLVAWLASMGFRSMYVWSRGEVLLVRRIFLFLGRRALGTSASELANDQESYGVYQSRKSKLMGISLVRVLWSAMTFFEHLVQINVDIRRKLRDGCVVVCDRYLWDSSVDLAVLNKKNPEWLSGRLNRLMWKFIPQPTVTFFIDIPPEEAMKRKNDIPSVDYVRKRTEHYQYLATCNSLIRINGCLDGATIHSKIVNIVGKYIEREGKVCPS